jgi:hypothetical protein
MKFQELLHLFTIIKTYYSERRVYLLGLAITINLLESKKPVQV